MIASRARLVVGVFGLALLALAGSARADALRLEGHAVQGGLMIGRVEPGALVRIDDEPVEVRDDGRFLIGFGREAAPLVVVEVRHLDGSEERRRVEVERREYAVQEIEGLPPNMVTPSVEELERIRAENRRIAEARARDTPVPYFDSGFEWPLIGTITGVYGTTRVLNGEPRQPHYGIDIAAPEGTPVHAAAAGVVALAEDDLFYTGATVSIDHGYGLTSLYSHLSRIDVEPGQMVEKGEVIGAVGATGRVTGPHLDWRVNLFTTRLDPALLVGPMPGTG